MLVPFIVLSRALAVHHHAQKNHFQKIAHSALCLQLPVKTADLKWPKMNRLQCSVRSTHTLCPKPVRGVTSLCDITEGCAVCKSSQWWANWQARDTFQCVQINQVFCLLSSLPAERNQWCCHHEDHPQATASIPNLRGSAMLCLLHISTLYVLCFTRALSISMSEPTSLFVVFNLPVSWVCSISRNRFACPVCHLSPSATFFLEINFVLYQGNLLLASEPGRWLYI